MAMHVGFSVLDCRSCYARVVW